MKKKVIIIAVQIAMCCLFIAIWRTLASGEEAEPKAVFRSLVVFWVILLVLATLLTPLNQSLWQNVILFVITWMIGSLLAIQKAGLHYAYESDPGVFSYTSAIVPIAPVLLYIVLIHWISKRVRKRLTKHST